MGMKVLLVDDHPVLRQGLKYLISKAFQSTVVFECASGPAAIEWVERESLDLVILDLGLPGCDGLEALRVMHAVRPRMPVLVVSMHAEDQIAVSVLRGGASGYLTKDLAAEKLVEAIRAVMAGGKFISAGLAQKLASALNRPPDRPPHESLSRRELQVLELLAQGQTVKEIAVELGLSSKTVSSHRTRLLEKLESRTTAELTQYALKAGLLRPNARAIRAS
jgi:DNA-binding NarL/FixJ family response regulator